MSLIEESNTEEMQMFRDMILRFLEQEVSPHYDTWEKNHKMPREMWNIMGSAGMLLVDFPEKYGSAGASFDVCQMIQEEICRMGFQGLGTGYNIHANIVAPYILNIGNQEQRDRWLPGMVTGEVLTALAMTEPGAGSDVAGMRTSAVKGQAAT